MIYKLESGDRRRVIPLMQGADVNYLDIIARSIIAGQSPGHVWADKEDAPTAALISDEGHCYYLAGDAQNPGFISNLKELAARQLIPHSVASGSRIFKLYRTSPQWDDKVEAIFDGVKFEPGSRTLFELNTPTRPNWKAELSVGVSVQRIDADLLRGETAGEAGSLVEGSDRNVGVGATLLTGRLRLLPAV